MEWIEAVIMENLMTMDEIYRAIWIGTVTGIPVGVGFWLAWLAYKPHIKDLRDHVRDLKETIFALLPNKKDDDDGDSTRL